MCRRLPDYPVQNFLMWQSGPFHEGVMRLSSPYPIILISAFIEGDDHERVAETRNHRIRGWHGSDELPAGRAGPRLIPSVDLYEFAE